MSKTNIGLFIVIAILIAVALLAVKSCRHAAQTAGDLQSYQKTLTDTIVHLKSGAVQKPAVFVTSEAFATIVSENSSLKKQLSAMQVKPKNVQNFTQVANTIYLHDTLRIHDTIKGKVVTRDSIRTVTETDSEYIANSVKNFLFKKDEYNVTITHSNKNVKTRGVQSLTLREQKKWYENGWLKVAIGAAGMYLLLK